MSKGSHRRQSSDEEASTSSARVAVRLFVPSRESGIQRSLRGEVVRVVEDLGWKIGVRRAHRCQVRGGPNQGRSYDLIEPRDAAETYSAAHRNRLLILATGSCFIRRNPSVDPARHRDLINLAGFAQYKASFGMIRTSRDILQFIERFKSWPSEDSCYDPQDPRVLPLHVFDNGGEWLHLEKAEQVAEFTRRFGPGGARADSTGRPWKQSNVFHGKDALSIATYRLNPGFHWDVTRGRGGERLVTTHEVWKFSNQYAYCNVYPDAYVRVGRKLSGGSCRLAWSAT